MRSMQLCNRASQEKNYEITKVIEDAPIEEHDV